MFGIDHKGKGPKKTAPETEGPYSRPIKDAPGKPDQLHPHLRNAEDRQEALIDEGVEESFPASDPLSPKHIT
jgi:hypothetical protein